MTGSTSAFSRLDVGSSDWLVGTPPFVFTEPFAVSVCIDDLTVGYGASSYPQIGRDTESGSVSYPDRNWIYDTTGNWRRSTFYGLTGDWIMRTSVSYDDGSTTGTGGSTGTSTTTTTGSTTTTGPTTTTGSTSSTHTTDTGISDTAEPTGTSEPGPRVTSLIQISPTEWQAGETPDLIVLGEWLQTGVELRVGGLSATNVELIPFIDDPGWGDTVLARAPSALPAGVHDVEVVNPDGSSAFLAQAVEVKADGAGLGDTGPGDVAKPATECGCQHGGAASLYWAPWCALLLAARRRGNPCVTCHFDASSSVLGRWVKSTAAI